MAALDDLTVLLEEEKPQQSSFHKQIRILKERISELSKTNYDLEREVRHFDQLIGFLIAYKKAIEESSENFIDLERKHEGGHSDDKQQERYGNLFFLLQTEASYLAQLTRIVSLREIDDLLQPVLFSLYGNQYEAREEHLLLTMFQLALKYEVSESETFNSLLRANTAITRMMTTYTRRAPGQEYLKATLGELVSEVVEQKDLLLEINPLKVYPEIYGKFADSSEQVTLERAMDDDAVQMRIRDRLTKIMNLTSKFVKAITGSLLEVPYGIRWLCSAIVTLVKEKYPDVSDTNINSLIGGFFLLRFLNPAIVTPKAYMLVSDPPSQCARRNLTMIAKLIQSMANKHVVGSHFKEEHMQPLRPFAMRHVNEIQNFLTKLFNFNKITDFYETLEIEQYLSLSKDIKITITPNEMYRIHELILKHKEELALTEDDPLHIILDELGPPGKQLSYSMNATISLTLTNRWDHSKVLRSDSIEVLTFRTPPVQQRCTKEQLRALFIKLLSMDAKLMEESSLLDVVTRAHFVPVNQHSSGEENCGKNTQEHRKRLEEQKFRIAGYIYKKYKAHPELKGMLSKDPVFFQEIKQEVQAKLQRYYKLAPKVKSLENVLETLQSQEAYLKDQLDVYKVYLNAVRAKAVTASSKKCVHDVSTPERSASTPVDFSYSQLEKEGVISHGDWSQRLTEKRPDLTITIACPEPGVYQMTLRNRGDPKTDHEVRLNLEELLELQHLGEPVLRLSEIVSLDVRRFLSHLHKTFAST
ncbi:uncharacterized protein [Montipora foliosa]|uniref:uncharacterized protein isoform X2 n=1 Tax=Montipora foliosa TaxID=591990 RepID=UPI0035F1A552